MLKSFLLSAVLAFTLLFGGSTAAQTPVPQICVVMVQSGFSMAEDRASGLTLADAKKLYAKMVADAGELSKEQKAVVKRTYKLLDDVWALNPLTMETLEPLLQKEFDLCLKVKGDYTKLIKV